MVEEQEEKERKSNIHQPTTMNACIWSYAGSSACLDDIHMDSKFVLSQAHGKRVDQQRKKKLFFL